jgi:hypothetical protein
MGDMHEIRAIPYLIKCGDNGIAMLLGRMGEDGLRALMPKLKETEGNIPAVYSVALSEMARKGDVGYITDEKLRQEVRSYLLKALNNSDETGRKYAVRGLGEFAIQGDTEATTLINNLAAADPTVGKAKDYPIRTEAIRVLNKLKQKGAQHKP